MQRLQSPPWKSPRSQLLTPGNGQCRVPKVATSVSSNAFARWASMIVVSSVLKLTGAPDPNTALKNFTHASSPCRDRHEDKQTLLSSIAPPSTTCFLSHCLRHAHASSPCRDQHEGNHVPVINGSHTLVSVPSGQDQRHGALPDWH